MTRDSADFVVVFAGKPAEAGRLRSLLEAEGIPAFLRDENIGTWEPWIVASGSIGAVKLVVPRAHAKRAAELLPVRRAKSTDP